MCMLWKEEKMKERMKERGRKKGKTIRRVGRRVERETKKASKTKHLRNMSWTLDLCYNVTNDTISKNGEILDFDNHASFTLKFSTWFLLFSPLNSILQPTSRFFFFLNKAPLCNTSLLLRNLLTSSYPAHHSFSPDTRDTVQLDYPCHTASFKILPKHEALHCSVGFISPSLIIRLILIS